MEIGKVGVEMGGGAFCEIKLLYIKKKALHLMYDSSSNNY